MITEEKIEKNYHLFKKALEQANVNTSKFDDFFGDRLKLASFSLTNNDGETAYDGSLIDIVMMKLTPIAVKINELLPENIRVEKSSLVKVCLLHEISKALMFEKNTNQWEITNRGMIYKYAPSKVAIKMGLKSLVIAQNLGVTFSEEEAEAMTILDRNSDDAQVKFYASPLATVLKNAVELTHLVNRN